jgi:hypothetical protein
MTERLPRCPACDGPREGGSGRIFCMKCYRELGKSTCSWYARLREDERPKGIALIRAQPGIVERRQLRARGAGQGKAKPSLEARS